MPETHKEINADTISLIPTHIPIPTASLDAQLKDTTKQILQILQKKKKTLPGPKLSNNTIEGLKYLQIYSKHTISMKRQILPQLQKPPNRHKI